MKAFLSALTAFLLAAAVGGWLLHRWLQRPPPPGIAARVPRKNNRPGAVLSRQAPPLQPGEHCNRLITRFRRGEDLPARPSANWPHFRGPDSDNIARQSPRLSRDWKHNPPQVLWTLPMGEGHAAPAVYKGRVYVLDYDEEKKADTLRCLDLRTGREIWRRWYEIAIKRNHGISRTIPAVSDDAVVTIGPKCQVMCVDRQTGDLRWGLDLTRDYGTTVPLWYTGQCPLIENGAAIIAPAGYWLLMGVDCKTGAIRWHTPNPKRWGMSHASVIPMRFGNRRAYVYAALGGVVAVSAEPDSLGEVLWESDQWNHRIVAPSPVPLPGNRVLLTAGHGAGTLVLPIRVTNGRDEVLPGIPIAKSVFACEQQTPIPYRGVLFSILPKDAGELREQLICYAPEKGLLWHSGKTLRFGLGPFLVADGLILALADNGILRLAPADPTRFRLLGQYRVFEDARDAWGPLALVDGLLLARDATRLRCIDIRQNRKDDTP